MEKRMSPKDWLWIVSGALISLLPPALLWGLYRRTPCLEALPWDPALHSLDGLKLYNNLITFSPVSFWTSLMAMAWWPPLPALMMLPFHFIAPRIQDAPVLLSLFCLFGSFFVPWLFFIFYSFGAHRKGWGLLAYTIYFAFLVSSSLTLRYSLLPMYELPGAFVTLVTVVFYWMAVDCRIRQGLDAAVRPYQRFGLAALCLLLMKWNYGLQILIVTLLAELVLSQRQYLVSLIDRLVRPLLRVRELWGLNLLILALGILILAIHATGGGRFRILGVSFSATGLGNPILIFMYLVVIRIGCLLKRHPEIFSALNPVHRELMKCLILPYTLWLLYPAPNRFHVLLGHLRIGQPSAPLSFSYDNLIFYLDFIARDYSVSVLQAWVLGALLVIAGIVSTIEKKRAAQILIVYAVFAWFSSSFLTNTKENRMIMNFMAVFPFLGAWGLIEWLRKRPLFIPLVAIPLVFPVLHRDKIKASLSRFEGSGHQCFQSEDFMVFLRHAIINRIDGDPRITVVGLSDMNALCPLVQLELHRKFPKYSRYPEPQICDHGYGLNDEDYVKKGVKEKTLKWVIAFQRSDSASLQASLSNIENFLNQGQVIKGASPFSLPGGNYRGVLYQLRD